MFNLLKFCLKYLKIKFFWQKYIKIYKWKYNSKKYKNKLYIYMIYLFKVSKKILSNNII
jgi:hypothetical protein